MNKQFPIRKAPELYRGKEAVFVYVDRFSQPGVHYITYAHLDRLRDLLIQWQFGTNSYIISAFSDASMMFKDRLNQHKKSLDSCEGLEEVLDAIHVDESASRLFVSNITK